MLIIGFAAGILSGLMGVGGGLIMVPALVLFVGFTQHQAQGTALFALLPPVALLSAYTYYKAGHVDLRMGLFLAVGLFVGGLVGAKLAVYLPAHVLKKMFALLLIVAAINMLRK